MMLIFFVLVAVFRPSISCLNGPFIYDNYTRSVTVDEGASIQLECYAGKTNASIIWYKGLLQNSTNQDTSLPNGGISYSGNILELPSITRNQRGRYVCSVDDQYGSASKYIQVTVNFIPIIIETQQIHRIESKELKLRCNAESEPPAEVRWFRNDYEIQPSEHYSIITYREFNDTLHSSFIIIFNHDFDENNIYKCLIQNQLGTVIATFLKLAEIYSYEND